MSKIVVVGSCNIDITVECDRWVHPGETKTAVPRTLP